MRHGFPWSGTPERHDPDWPRTYAAFSALSVASLALPFVLEMGPRLLLLPILAALVGAAVGVLVRGLLARVPPRRRIAVGTVIAPVIAAVGGGTLAVCGMAVTQPDPLAPATMPLATVVLTTWSSVVAWVHSTWFVPSVLELRRQGEPASTAVLMGPVLVWIAGVVGLFVAMVVAAVVSAGVAWI